MSEIFPNLPFFKKISQKTEDHKGFHLNDHAKKNSLYFAKLSLRDQAQEKMTTIIMKG